MIGKAGRHSGPFRIAGHWERTPQSLLLSVSAKEAGARLDSVLAEHMSSRSAAQRLLAAGRVRIAGAVEKKASRRLKAGETLTARLPRPVAASVFAEDIPLDILFADDDIIVVNKPKGMVVHPAPGNWSGTLVNALLYQFGASLSGIGGVRRPGIVHRLDKDTSGAMVVAKNDTAHQHLAAQIKQHAVRRVYVAIVHGHPPDEGVVRAPIGRHPVNRLHMAVVPNGKPAVTHFRVLERYTEYSLIAARLETGRTHQIRVHMAFAGFPVAGDPLYGPHRPHLFSDGQALHAWQITFTHPGLGVGMTCVAPLPAGFAAVLQELRGAESASAAHGK